MSLIKNSKILNSSGFTLVELLVVISLSAIAVASLSSFFLNYIVSFSHYQTDAGNYTQLSTQAIRVSQVLRGITDIVSATSNDIVLYAYFSPNDSYVSQVHYYISNNGKSLSAEVTPLSANPPNGTLLTAQKRTSVIISNYYQAPSTNLFNYYDASGSQISAPVSDEHSVDQIQVNLTTKATYNSSGQPLSITVGLRNRKTAL